jgi:hypothetical protein
MMPPELLHTSGSGLITYMFESLRVQLGGGIDRDTIDQDHVTVNTIIRRQSERDFPRASMRNGLIDGTKCQSSERKGNLFRLLCIAHRSKARGVLQKAMGLSDIQYKKFLSFLMSYLAMEEWLHASKDKEEVNNARENIANVLLAMQKFFPRSDHTNGYKLPKMHGMTKMQSYIKQFGSGINFFGGPGEAAHKTFVKAAGLKTQPRAPEFAQQTAHQYYNYLISNNVMQRLSDWSSKLTQVGSEYRTRDSDSENDDNMVLDIHLSGQYEITITNETIDEMRTYLQCPVFWLTDNAKKSTAETYRLDAELIQCILTRIDDTVGITNKIIGYTRAIIKSPFSDEKNIYYSHLLYKGEPWYDWALVHFKEIDTHGAIVKNYYPSRLLGFITINGSNEAVVQCALEPLEWDDLQKKFVLEIILGKEYNVSFVTVPIKSIAHPLCVIPDDGDDIDKYFVFLPKRNWSHFFGDTIIT